LNTLQLGARAQRGNSGPSFPAIRPDETSSTPFTENGWDLAESTTLLGEWYATALFWRPQVALLVNEPTLLPVLIPLAPGTTVPARSPSRSPRSSPPTAHRARSSFLLDLAVRLAATPCSPLYRMNISPDRELAAHIRENVGRSPRPGTVREPTA
jgi:hypothetical protein